LADDHRIEILLATYQIERQDEQNSAVLITAVTGTALAFIIAATAYLNGQGKTHHLPDWLALGAAIPVWALAGLIIYQVAASGLRMRYIMHLESMLSRSVFQADRKTYPRYIALHHGLFESGGLRRNTAHVSLGIITFLSPLALGVLFTFFVMTDVARHIDARLSVVIGYAIFYSLLALLNAWVLLIANYGMTDKRRGKLNAWADSKLSEYEQDW
jgi:hypothetical protein